MKTVGAQSSKDRPTVLGNALDRSPWAPTALLIAGITASVAVALFAGYQHPDHEGIFVNTDVFVATAGLFVGALAVERLTELLIAPWAGKGTRRVDRATLIGVGSLLIGTVVAATLGLRIIEIVRGVVIDPDGWGKLAISIDVLASGLAIGAGGKPLHDLLSRFEKQVESAKAKSLGIELTALGSGAHKVTLRVARKADEPGADLAKTLAKVLPGWTMNQEDSTHATVTRRTSAEPDSSEHIHHRFAAAHRLNAAGLTVGLGAESPESEPTGDGRESLRLLGLADGDAKGAGWGDGVTVAVLDTGTNPHTDGVPAGQLTEGYDTIEGKPGATDPLDSIPGFWHGDFLAAPGHGTAVAGVIAAPGEADTANEPRWDSPMLGVAPKAVIAPYRVMTGQAHLADKDVAEGVRRAVTDGCDVINMSLGGFGFDGLRAATAEAAESGVIVVCAAGNLFGGVVDPAAFPHTIGVSSVRQDGQPYVAGASNGPEVLVVAPGVEVRRPSFDKTSKAETLKGGTGTTYAAAHVSGLAALWLSKHTKQKLVAAYPGVKLSQAFAHVLTTSAVSWSSGSDLSVDWGVGRVHAANALAVTVLEADDGPALSQAQLDAALPLPSDFTSNQGASTADRIAAGVAIALGPMGATETREKAINGLWSAIGRLGFPTRKDPGVASDPQQAANLIAAELSAHAKLDAALAANLTDATEIVSVPTNATDELRIAIEQHNDAIAHNRVVDRDFLVGTSAGLKRALRGKLAVTQGLRWVGVLALAIGVVLALIPDDVADLNGGITASSGAVGTAALLGLGLYGGALAIERLLEFTVGRVAYRGIPGREADRAMVMLGTGIVVGVIAARLLDISLFGLLADQADQTADICGDADSCTEPIRAGNRGRIDVLVTGLALGGGAKPVHDLLTRIRVAKDNAGL